MDIEELTISEIITILEKVKTPQETTYENLSDEDKEVVDNLLS